jgi:parvulin-like peptidyl-prolyl isomerase
MKTHVCVAFAVVAAMALGLACSKKNKVEKATAFPDSVVAGEVIAIVNGDTVSSKDLQVLAYTTTPGASDSLKSRAFNNMLLDQIIDRVVFTQEARAVGVTVPDSLVNALMNQFMMHFEGQMADKMKEVGLVAADFRKSIHRDLMIRAYVQQKLEPSIAVEEADVRAFFDQNTSMFAGVDSVRCRHIIMMFSPADTDDARAERRKKMEEIRQRAVKGESFERLAQQYSQDGSAQFGGDLGYFARGTMVKEFEDVAFSLKKGQISSVVQTQFGLHVIQCVDKKAPAPANYDNAKPQIEAMMRQQRLGTELQNRLKKSRDAAIITRNYDTDTGA